jgi:hypothetical protein
MTYHPMRLLFVGRPSLLFVGRATGTRGRGRESALKTWWQRLVSHLSHRGKGQRR